MQYTANYQFRKPVRGVDEALIDDLNYNADKYDALINASQNSICAPYDKNTTYNTGDCAMHDGLLYECQNDGVTGAWDADDWERTTAAEHGGGGGGGNADYVELTQAEYDELTPQEKMNGKLYFITDGQGEGDAYFYPIIYSTEEREVGVWIDNKPLYAKTIDFGALPNNTTKALSSGLTGVKVVNIGGIAISASGFTTTIPHPELGGNGDIQVDFLATNEVRIKTNTDYSGFTGYVTLYYTKTTDVAGSGKYNTLGVPMVHYSTDEQVVGTWIDGKTLYQKTCNVTTNTNCNNTSWTSLPLDNPPANADYMVDAELHGQCPNTNRTYRFQFENGAVKIASLTSEYILANTKITFRYTKSQS